MVHSDHYATGDFNESWTCGSDSDDNRGFVQWERCKQRQEERKKIMGDPTLYMIIGDVDKSFHLPECACTECERWRMNRGRPTHAYLKELKEPR